MKEELWNYTSYGELKNMDKYVTPQYPELPHEHREMCKLVVMMMPL